MAWLSRKEQNRRQRVRELKGEKVDLITKQPQSEVSEKLMGQYKKFENAVQEIKKKHPNVPIETFKEYKTFKNVEDTLVRMGALPDPQKAKPTRQKKSR